MPVFTDADALPQSGLLDSHLVTGTLLGEHATRFQATGLTRDIKPK